MLLTKQDKQILYKLYSEYLNRRKTGLSISESSNFVSGRSIHENIFPEMPYEDIDHSLRQLGKNNYLKNTYADNEVYHCVLSNDAIAYMEDLPKETFLSVADFVSKFIPW